MQRGERRFLVLVPVQTEATEGLREYLARAGFKDVDAVGLSPGLNDLRGREDSALIAPDNIRKAKEAEAVGYSAIIIGCHQDANLYLLRDAVRIPVIGPLELAMHFCAMLAHRFSILVPNEALKDWTEENIIRYGFESKVASVRLVHFDYPLENVIAKVSQIGRLNPASKEIIQPTLEECIKAIEDDGATAITYGCAAFRWMGDELSQRLKERSLEVPVINPLTLAIEVARALVNLKLTHSVLGVCPSNV